MQFGLFGGAQSAASDPAKGYRDYLDFLLEAEVLGYRGCFLTEHHFTGWGQVSSPLHMLTWLAARTTTLRLGTAEASGRAFDPMSVAVARDACLTEDVAEALRRRAAGHQRMIDAARTPGREGGSHILAWADRPEARTEAALYGSAEAVEEKIAALTEAGVHYVLLNILGNSRETLRGFASLGQQDAPSDQTGSHRS